MTNPTVIGGTNRYWASDPNAAAQWRIEFDSTISEDVTFASKVTEHPVASGSPVMDHMYDLPAKLTVAAVVSDVLRWQDLARVQEGMEPNDPYFGSAKSRSALALERLVTLQRSHESFFVQTGLLLFQSMVVEEIHYVTDMRSAAILSFTAKLTEVKIVSTQTVIYPAKKDKKTKKQTTPPVEKKAEAPEPELTAKQRASLLLKAGQAILGFK